MRRPVMVYALAFAALITAVMLRWLLHPLMGDTLPLVTLFGAVAAAVWLGGYRPAILVMILGYVSCAYLFITHRGRLEFEDVKNVIGFVTYLLTCSIIIGFGEAMRNAQIRANERREVLQVTLRSIGDAVITTDIQGKVMYLNSVAETLTGWSRPEALGKPLDTVFHVINEETRQPVESPATKALREGAVVGLANHTLLIQKGGAERAIDDSAAPIRDEYGQVSGCVLIFRDVTTQRRLEKENASQLVTARLLASIVETSDDAIISKSLDGVIQSWNAAAERLFGHSAGQAVGRHISLIIPPERIGEEDHIISSLRAGRPIDHFETERIRSDGRRILVSLTISPIKDASGNVIGASKIVRDVTQQRRAEERERHLLAEAADANAKFRAFFEQGALFAGIMSADGTLLESNRLAWEGSGYSRDQIIGKPLWEHPWWTPSSDLVEKIKAASARAAAGQTFQEELPYYVAGGHERIADVIIQPIRDETGRTLFLALTGTDITDRKRAEADREKFVTLIENSTDFIGICDLNGVPVFVNRAGLDLVGLESLEQLKSKLVTDFFFPEDQSKITGEFFPAVLNQGHGEIEIRFRHFQTGEARWMAYKVLTLRDSSGRAVAFATVSQDITERKRLADSMKRLAAELSEADRRKDEFLAILAHELRNPLATISNAVQFLRLEGADKAALQSASTMLERQVGQMARLVDDLLDVNRIRRGKIELRRERIELAPVLNQAVEAARPLLKSMNHELTVTLPTLPVHLSADTTRLAQVIGNLVNNAAKFTDKGGHIWVTAELEERQVVIRVRDNGIGIAAEHIPYLFEMFRQVGSSLERSRDGLGIGLMLVKTLVEMHGGTVEARSEGLGRGSEFTVRLPILVDSASLTSRTDDKQPAAVSSRRVLIVDDNDDSAGSLAMLLKLSGHETHTARDGQEALEAAERLLPDVVLLDIGLPLLNGYEVCRRIREQPWGKDIVLIAVTGWGQEEDRNRSKTAGFNTHFAKPVDYDLLMKLLASLPRRREDG